MIRTLAYFQNLCALNSREPLAAFLRGAQDHGIKPEPDSMDADAAVIWSVLWSGRMRGNREVFQHYRSQLKPVIVIDVGALVRNHTWKVAVNHVTAQGVYGHTRMLDHDRPKKLGLALSSVQPVSPAILVCSQHANSLQMQNFARVEDWVNLTVSRLKQHTDRPLIIRPHPRSLLRRDLITSGLDIQDPHKLPNTYDSFDLRFGYHAIVNHNSGPGIQAAIMGCRPMVDSTSLAYPVSVQPEQLEDPYTVDRDQWLVEIAHTEYTVPELEAGAWVPRLADFL